MAIKQNAECGFWLQLGRKNVGYFYLMLFVIAKQGRAWLLLHSLINFIR